MQSVHPEQDASDQPTDAPYCSALADEGLPGKDPVPRLMCRARTPLFLPDAPDADGQSQVSLEDRPPRKRRRTDPALVVRRFLDLEAEHTDDSAEDDEEDGQEEGFIDNTPARVASGLTRPATASHDLEERAREAHELAMQARRFQLLAQQQREPPEARAPPQAKAPLLTLQQRLEQHMVQLQRPLPSCSPLHRWARLRITHGEAQISQLVLAESTTSVLVVVPKDTPEHEKGGDTTLFSDSVCLARLSVKSGKAFDQALSWDAGPTQDDIELWDRANTGLLGTAVDPMAGTACVPGCRVVVDGRDLEHAGKSGFLVGRINSTLAVIRSSFNGTRIHLSAPTIYHLLHDRVPRDDDEIVVDMAHTRRHLLSFRSPLQILDRVVILGTALNLPRGRVTAIDSSTPYPMVTIIAPDDVLVQVPMSAVARDFALGDLVKVIAGTHAGVTGIVVNTTRTHLRDDGLPLGLEIFSVSKRGGSESGAKVQRWEQAMKLMFSGMEGEDDMVAGLAATNAGYDLIQILCEQAQFTEPAARPGGWTAPSTPEPLYRAQEMLKADTLKDEGMRGGRLYRNTPVLIVRHEMRGRQAVVEDHHEVLVRATGERKLVFTVRIDNSPKTWQVDEKAVIHLWTGLPLRKAQHVTPWAGVMKWNWSEESEAEFTCIDGMRTPLQSSSSTDFDWALQPDEQELPMLRPPPPPPIGKDGGRWMCIPKLKGKRVDVVVLQKTAGRVTARQANAEGQSGYIELMEGMTEELLNTPIVVRLGNQGKRIRIAPRWLAPMRRTRCPPLCMTDLPISGWKGRVVVIGPDSIGGTDHMGEYGWTAPLANPDMTWVKFARDHRDQVQLEGYYHVESLCRAYKHCWRQHDGDGVLLDCL